MEINGFLRLYGDGDEPVFEGPVIVGETINPDIPEPLRGAIESLYQTRSGPPSHRHQSHRTRVNFLLELSQIFSFHEAIRRAGTAAEYRITGPPIEWPEDAGPVPTIRVYSTQGERVLIFEGPLIKDGRINPEIPSEIRTWMGIDGDVFLGNPREYPSFRDYYERYLSLRMPGALGLIFHGYAVAFDPPPRRLKRRRRREDESRKAKPKETVSGPWWEAYGVALPEDEPVAMPSWPELSRIRLGIQKVADLFLQSQFAAYRNQDGEVYIRLLLDLGDRPLRLELYERETLLVEVPVYFRLRSATSIYRYILETLSERYRNFRFRLDAGHILVATAQYDASGILQDLDGFLRDFIHATTRARQDLEHHLRNRGLLRG